MRDHLKKHKETSRTKGKEKKGKERRLLYHTIPKLTAIQGMMSQLSHPEDQEVEVRNR